MREALTGTLLPSVITTCSKHHPNHGNTQALNVLLVGIILILTLHMRKLKSEKLKNSCNIIERPLLVSTPLDLWQSMKYPLSHFLPARWPSAANWISGVKTCLETKASGSYIPISRLTTSVLRFCRPVNGPVAFKWNRCFLRFLTLFSRRDGERRGAGMKFIYKIMPWASSAAEMS